MTQRIEHSYLLGGQYSKVGFTYLREHALIQPVVGTHTEFLVDLAGYESVTRNWVVPRTATYWTPRYFKVSQWVSSWLFDKLSTDVIYVLFKHPIDGYRGFLVDKRELIR